MSFHREYLVRLPLPLAQLYSRAHNAKDARGRHDNTFYLFEALVKLAVAPLVAVYLREVSEGAQQATVLRRLLGQLALPSLGQWVAILRELSRHFGTRADAASHPLGHLWGQLDAKRRDLPGALALYQRIKNGPDGQTAGDQSVSLLALLDALVQYRNAVFGHGGPRFASFYEQEMGPLLFPAADELLADETCQWLGPRGTRLVYLTELRGLDEQRFELGLRELVGLQAERIAPVEIPAAQAASMTPQRMGVLWPGQTLPVPLDPLLIYRETELSEEVLFLNRELQGRQVQYLSYTTGRTERDRTMGDAMARLLSRITGHDVSPADLETLQEQSVTETPSVESLFEEATTKGRIVGDYEILTQIGRGGMGVVYLARQLSLGRIVALKMLPTDLAGDEVALGRFRREMRALARCDHPHIVKVLASGAFPDGQLFYAMEYVPGADLEHVWRELAKSSDQGNVSSLGSTTWASAVLSASRKQREQTTRAASGDSTANSLNQHPIPQLTDTWQKSSAAVAAEILPPLPELPDTVDDPGGYARRVALLVRDAALSLQAVHEQHIVHRDVKPANLMLTPDGQRVVLMDFGLAKGDSMSLTASRAGGFLGTLRYAAPEQLASASVPVGPAADLRGLGVVLWELLTRKRLFADAEDERQMGQWILNRDVPPLRSIDPTLDRDLEAIVARACERDASRRIHSAADMAQFLKLYADGQPLPIRPPGLGELTRRWVRSHAGLVTTAAVAAIAIVIATIVAFVFINAAKNDAIVARDEAKQSEEKAKQSAQAADQQRNLALDTLNTLVFDLQDQMADTPDQRRLKQTILDTALQGLEKISRSFQSADNSDARTDRLTAVAQDKIADILLALGATQKAAELFERANQVFDKLAKADPTNNLAQVDLAINWQRLGDVSTQQGSLTAAKKFYQQSLEVLQRLGQADPADAQTQRLLSIDYQRLGDVSIQEEDLAEAKRYYQLDLEIRDRLAQADPADVQAQLSLSICYNKMGDATFQEGDMPAAKKNYQQSLDIRQSVVKADPSNTLATWDVAVSFSKLGDVSVEEQNLEEAKKNYQQYLEITQRLALADPTDPATQRELAISYNKLGEVSAKEEHQAEAKKYYQQVLEIRERLAQTNPSDVQVQRDLSISYEQLGDVSQQEGELTAVKKYYQLDLEIRDRLAQADPTSAEAQRDLSVICNKLGSLAQQQGEFADARKYYQWDLEIRDRLAQAEPSNAPAQLELAICRSNLATVYQLTKNWELAIENYAVAQKIFETLKTSGRLPKAREILASSIQPAIDECRAAMKGGRSILSPAYKKPDSDAKPQ